MTLRTDESVAQYHTVRATTGVLGATLAAGSTVFAMRHAAAPTRDVYVTGIQAQFAATVAFTTASQQLFALERFSTATPSGGTAYTGMKHDTGSAASGLGDIRAATTAALTVTSVVFDGNTVPLLGTASPVVSSTIVGPYLDFSQSPIRLRAGEGLCIRNIVLWPAAGTGVLTASVTWYE